MSIEINEAVKDIERNPDGTSTMELARELFRASWTFNVGRTVNDIPLFDSLDSVDQFHLLETAYACEQLLEKYDTEEEKVLTWNLARVAFEAYCGHPASQVPNLPWDSAPRDMKTLYYRYAQWVLAKWYQVKTLPRHKGWLQVNVMGSVK